MRRYLPLLLLLLPTLAYILWRLVSRRGTEGLFRGLPALPLALAGTLLFAAGMAAWALWGEGEPGGTYIPPRTAEDGTILPGRIVEEAPDGR